MDSSKVIEKMMGKVKDYSMDSSKEIEKTKGKEMVN
jgi:hypothetical protein